MAKKKKTACFVLTLKLNTEKYQSDVLNKRFEVSRKIYNACLGEILKRYKHLKRSRAHKTTIGEYIFVRDQISDIKSKYLRKVMPTAVKAELKILEKRKKELSKTLSDFRLSYGVSEYQLHAFVGPMNRHFGKNMDINTAQKLATRAYWALEKVVFSDGEDVHFKRFGGLNSVEGKTNRSGIRFKENAIHWNGLKIPVMIRKNDLYAQEALSRSRVKYCRIVRRFVKNKYVFYVQLVMEGTAPPKRNPDATVRRTYGSGRVGIDPSLQSIAVVSDTKASLVELAPSVDSMDKKIRRIQRYLDRSRRATNLDLFNADGTVKRGKHRWEYSNGYMRAFFELKELGRKKRMVLRQEHNTLANEILALGTEIYVEKMDFKTLAKRARDTEISEKTGRYKRKKRFGKSIGTKAPVQFLTILDQKLQAIGKEILYINTYTFKASQYDHVTDSYAKKSLSQRWTSLGDLRVQRDLYSAFLIMNSHENLQHTDRDRCFDTFEPFLAKHDQEIERLRKTEDLKLFSSFGVNQTA